MRGLLVGSSSVLDRSERRPTPTDVGVQARSEPAIGCRVGRGWRPTAAGSASRRAAGRSPARHVGGLVHPRRRHDAWPSALRLADPQGPRRSAVAIRHDEAHGQPKHLAHADWLVLLLDRETSWQRDRSLMARRRAAKPRHQASNTSTTALPSVLIAPCSRSSRRANGSTPTTISPGSVHPASAKAGWLAPAARMRGSSGAGVPGTHAEIPGRSTLAPLRARTPGPAWARRAVDEGVRSCPSRMREICTPGAPLLERHWA
jgi:hypothetical protein